LIPIRNKVSEKTEVMKKICLNIILLFTLILAFYGQDSRRLFLGLQPDITREIKDNEEKIYSVNVVPMVAQAYLNELTGIRISPVVNLEGGSRLEKSCRREIQPGVHLPL
jgi:hypothetical protein